ncbi:hypothetical protein ACWD6R_34695 [Streptomyces sp. NPDC005151]
MFHVDIEQGDVVAAGCGLHGVVDEIVGEGLRRPPYDRFRPFATEERAILTSIAGAWIPKVGMIWRGTRSTTSCTPTASVSVAAR